MSRIPKESVKDLSLEEIIEKHFDCFENDYNRKGIQRSSWLSSSLYLNFNCNPPHPIFAKATIFPNSIIKEVNDELKRLEKLGLITKLSSSEWGTPIGFRRNKNGDIRLYGKFDKTVNKFLKPYEYHSHESAEQKMNKLKCGKKFSVLNLSSMYNMLRLSENCNKYCNWNTHFGIYRVNYLQTELWPFKLSLETIFNNMVLWDYKPQYITLRDKCVCKNSKIIVTAGSQEEHLKALQELFMRIARYGYLVNKEKSKFMVNSIKLSNYVIEKNKVINLNLEEHSGNKKVYKFNSNKHPTTAKQFKEFIRDEMDISEMTLNNCYDDY